MSIKPKDLLNNKKDLDKKICIEEISLDNISIDDLTYNGDNYNKFINLNSFLDNVSACQISDAFKEIAHRSGVLYNLKSINNLKAWGKIFTSKTNSDDWGTITISIDEADEGDVLLVETSDMDAAVFFACTTFDSNTFQYKALDQDFIDKNPLGVLYAYDLVVPDYAMSAFPDGTRLSAIGKQLFKNPGSQSGFMLNVPEELSFDDLAFKLPKSFDGIDSIKRVHKFYFRHSVEVSRKVMKYSDHGSIYFPGDILQKHWNQRKSKQNTQNGKCVSLSAVKENVKANSQEAQESISNKLIRDYGYTIIDQLPSFTTEELHDFYYELNNGGWDDFCADIVFPGSDGQRYWNAFHDMPTVDEYRRFFKP